MMKKLIVILLILFVGLGDMYAQMIYGNVYEDRTKEPIPGVNVYLDGTSIHTTTDVNGRFELRTERFINTRLIISHVIYETVAVHPNEVFSIQDTLSGKIVRLIDHSEKKGLNDQSFFGKVTFLYDRKQSDVTFMTDSFFVDQYGNTSAVNKIMYSGYVSDQRLGNMLPLNYELP